MPDLPKYSREYHQLVYLSAATALREEVWAVEGRELTNEEIYENKRMKAIEKTFLSKKGAKRVYPKKTICGEWLPIVAWKYFNGKK